MSHLRLPFRISCSHDKLSLVSHGLPPDHEAYLRLYLDRVNRYKVIGFFRDSPVFSLYQPPLATQPGCRSLALRIRRKFSGDRLPATATIAVNSACQCECDHCSAVYYNHSSKPDLSQNQLQEALRQTTELGVTHIILLGGEPLLRKDLCAQIRAVPPEAATIILFSNGEYLTPSACRSLKEAGLMGAFVSLDCAQADRHDHFRKRQGLFHKAVAGIQNLKEAGLLVGISSHLSPQRMAERGFAEMMELGRDLGVNEVTFFDAIPTGRWLADASCLLQSEHRLEIKRLVRVHREKPDYPGVSAQSTLTSECGSAFCFAANTQFYLTAAGEMCPCDFTPLTVGTFPAESILQLWRRMIRTEPYDRRAKACRMQDAEFRRKYLLPHLQTHAALPFVLSTASIPTDFESDP